MTGNSRRDFLKMMTNALLALSGALGIGGLVRYLSYQFDAKPRTEFDIGSVDDYPINSRTVLAEIPAIIIHDNEGFQAISLACTHLGCTVELRSFGFECPCHGSRFDSAGSCIKGPAVRQLKTLRIETSESGNLCLITT
jgi:nitrite reductase/ring-hydroxylating ferredoxin subunit